MGTLMILEKNAGFSQEFTTAVLHALDQSGELAGLLLSAIYPTGCRSSRGPTLKQKPVASGYFSATARTSLKVTRR